MLGYSPDRKGFGDEGFGQWMDTEKIQAVYACRLTDQMILFIDGLWVMWCLFSEKFKLTTFYFDAYIYVLNYYIVRKKLKEKIIVYKMMRFYPLNIRESLRSNFGPNQEPEEDMGLSISYNKMKCDSHTILLYHRRRRNAIDLPYEV